MSLAPTLLGLGEQCARDHLHWELASYGGQPAVRFGRWKALRRGTQQGIVAVELYDLATDPHETQDLAATRPELVAVVTNLFERARSPSEVSPLAPKR